MFKGKDGYSVFAPLSRQEKGIDLLLTHNFSGGRTTASFQIKSSRTYSAAPPKKAGTVRYRFYTWFNRIDISDRADFYLLVGFYPSDQNLTKRPVTPVWWQTLILAFDNKSMTAFMRDVLTKKGKPDRMFGFGFNDTKHIVLTRGDRHRAHTDYSQNLLAKQGQTIRERLQPK